MGGMAFVAADTVLPNMVHSMGGPDWLISASPVLIMTGILGPQLLAAHWIERKAAVHRYLSVVGLFQRGMFLLAGLGLLLFGESMPTLALVLAVLGPLLSGVFTGFSVPAWTELVSRTIPPEKRASMHALRNMMSALIALLAGWSIHEILTVYPDHRGYALLFGICFVLIALSWFFFIRLRETALPERIQTGPVNLMASLRALPAFLKADRQLRLMAVVSFVGPSIFIVVPFLAVQATEVTGRGASFVGMLVLAKTAGMLVSNLIGAYLGDRYGGRILMILSRLGRIVLCLIVPFAQTEWAFLVAFFFFGSSFTLNVIGHSVLSLEISPDGRRPTYVALISAAGFPGIVLVPVIATVVYSMTDKVTPLALISLAGALIGLGAIWLIREPRQAYPGT